MGIIIGKFRKKKSTYDILEKLEQEITSIEEFGRSTEQTKKKIVGRFLLLAVLVYVILAFILYFYYHKISTNQRLICIIPLTGFPLVIWVIKRCLTWYYSRKIIKNKKKLVSLKEEKSKLLDNVMETETYKVAKKILDKFGTDTIRKTNIHTLTESTPEPSTSSAVVPIGQTTTLRLSPSGLRQRNISLPNTFRGRMSLGGAQTPFRDRQIAQVQSVISPIPNRPIAGAVVPASSAGPIPGTPLPLPRSILPRDRTVLDKMVDYLVGDGPSNRYALICRKCNSHNGMALREEFEYLSFRCCYCSEFNPARKMRPTGPKVESNTSQAHSDSSDSDKNSPSDSDSESPKPLVSERKSVSPTVQKNIDLSELKKKCFESETGNDPDVDSQMEVSEPDTDIASEETLSREKDVVEREPESVEKPLQE